MGYKNIKLADYDCNLVIINGAPKVSVDLTIMLSDGNGFHTHIEPTAVTYDSTNETAAIRTPRTFTHVLNIRDFLAVLKKTTLDARVESCAFHLFSDERRISFYLT